MGETLLALLVGRVRGRPGQGRSRFVCAALQVAVKYTPKYTYVKMDLC